MSPHDYADKFSRLRVNARRGATSPHKPCMLLALIDLAEAGGLEKNEVGYLPDLIERFTEYFEVVRSENDHPNAYFPFFHLRGDRFRKLIAAEGQAAVLQAMKTARSHGDITVNVSHAELDEELHALLQKAPARDELRAVLIGRWFADKADAVWKMVREHQQSNIEESELRKRIDGGEQMVRDVEPPRSAAFRRLVLQAYDYRCAASGWRIMVPGGTSLIEAAHLIPFSESHNDDPRNGLALTPTFHTALDKNLIAPGPDMKWHVSPIFDERIPDNRPLIELKGKDVIFVGVEKYMPARKSLEWRLERLMS